MATIAPTVPTFSQIFAPVVLATGTKGTRYTLDLTDKRGAMLYARIGRRAATALTRSGYIAVRPTNNAGLPYPSGRFDLISSTPAAISNTVASGGASGTDTVTLTSAASFAVGDTICLHSDDSSGNRVEFARILVIATNTLTVDFDFAVSHSAADRVTTMGDIITQWLPGGDIYEIRAANGSGQALLFALDAVVDPGDTVTG